MATQLLLQLLLAHILTDFVFQPTAWVVHKRKERARSIFLYIHSIIAGVLTYILLQHWDLWHVALFITLTHFGIDLWKLNHKKDNLRIFLLDQLFHIIIILISWIYITQSSDEILPFLERSFSSSAFLAISIGYLLVVFPVGFLVGKATKRWHNELETGGKTGSLEAAGRYIGIFERILVLTFILTDNFSAIGFLIAAKSILRFSDKSEAGARKQTEYVLIGTLMSFAITIVIGFLVRQLAF